MAGQEREHVVQKDGTEKGAPPEARMVTAIQEAWSKGASTARDVVKAAQEIKDIVPVLHLDGWVELRPADQSKTGEKPGSKPSDKSGEASADKPGAKITDALPNTDDGNLVRSLNQLAKDTALQTKAALRGLQITQETLGTALLIDDHGPASRNFLSEQEREAVKTLFEKWSRLDRKSLTPDELANFSDSKIGALFGEMVKNLRQDQPSDKPSGQAEESNIGHRPARESTAKDRVSADAAPGNGSKKPVETAPSDRAQQPDASVDEAGKPVEGGQQVVQKLLELLKRSDKQDPSDSSNNPAAVEQVKPDVKPLPSAEFAARAQSLFAKIDKDNDGILSEQELAGAMEDKQFQGQDAQTVAALYKVRGELKGLSNDQWGSESGITVSDLVRYQEIDKKRIEEYIPAVNAKDWLADEKNFKQIDADGNGFLSKAELERTLQRTDLDQKARDSVSYLLRNVGTIQSASDDEWGFENGGITSKDLKAHTDNIVSNSNEAAIIGKVNGVMYRTSESQKGNANYNLYGSENPLDSIKPAAIRQGMIGDCYFLSALGAVAQSNPKAIAEMIKDNKDGTYTVTFPGAPNEPVTVNAPTEAEAGLYNGVGPEGTWALVMEKAYGKYCQESIFRRSPFNPFGGNTPAEGGDGGGRTSGATTLLTGKDTNTDSTTFTSQREMAKRLEAATKDGRAITAGINKSLLPTFLGGSDNTDDGFPRAHAYSIVGFKPDGNGGGKVIIRNPWGGSDGTASGTIEITMEQFMKNFSDVTIQS